MGAINTLLQTSVDAINEVGKKSDYFNDGYHFVADSNTRSLDDITIKSDGEEFVLACIWKNLPSSLGYKPSLPNFKKALSNYDLAVVDKSILKEIITDLMVYASNDINAKDSIDKANGLLESL